jgi:hypothetical protein
VLIVPITILSTIARLGSGCFEPIQDRTAQWRRELRGVFSFSRKEEAQFSKGYLTPMLRCGKPASVPDSRWVLKALSNDQTAFSGFTSLVDVVDNNLGYDGQIRLLPKAAFVEPFVLRGLTDKDQQELFDLRDNLQNLDSTQVDEVNQILAEAERIAPVTAGRKKGKSPIFFYSVTDKPFQLPASMYRRMEAATSLVSERISEVASRFEGSLDEAMFGDIFQNVSRQMFTGSIDFMVAGDDIYVIDIGSPAVGYMADIEFASEAIGRKPEFGLDVLAECVGEEIEVYSGLSDELGFFALENSRLVDGLRARGINVTIRKGGKYQVKVDGVNFPTDMFDYVSRNQPLRNRILEAITPSLSQYRVRVPDSKVTIPERSELGDFYERTRTEEDLGIVVKKKVLFGEYGNGSGYFKPLVTPLWSRELRNNAKTSTLFEQFVPSLINVDIAGDESGKRCYEVRMYFCVGGDI